MSSYTADTFRNPIIPGFNPDPSIVRLESDFFLVTSSFEYFPGLPIYHSKDLIKWNLIGHALTRPSQVKIATPEPGGGIWAPTLRYHEGAFYILTSCFDRYRPQFDDRVWPRGFYVKTMDIWDSTTWSDPVYFDHVGFDHDIFWDDDGTAYLSATYRKLVRTPDSGIKDFAIHVCTVDLSTGNSTCTPKLIRESPSGVSEGSHIIKRGRYYYLFTAEGGTETGHSEWVSRSARGPFGPWELGPTNPLVRNTTKDEIQNTGHSDIVEDSNGRWWAVLLAVRPTKKQNGWERSVFGRETFLIPVSWEDDWPIFNNGQMISLESHGQGLYLIEHGVEWEDDFSSSDLRPGWYRKNSPVKADYSLQAQPYSLRLFGSPYNLSSPACPTLLLRKQTHRSCRWETRLSFRPTVGDVEAGTAVYWNYFTYSTIGITLSPDGKKIVKFRHAKGTVVEHALERPDSEVALVISCGNKYNFGYREEKGPRDETDQEDFHWLGHVSNEVMTTDPPIGAAFTGMMFGLYAFGELQRCLEPADFRFARVS